MLEKELAKVRLEARLAAVGRNLRGDRNSESCSVSRTHSEASY